MTDHALRQAAEQAGIEINWRDALGHDQVVQPDVLRAVMAALGKPTEQSGLPPLLTVRVGEALPIGITGPYRLGLEQGEIVEGRLEDGWWLPAIDQPGYHNLEIGNQKVLLAVAPRRCFALADAMPGQRAWGLAAQLYSLRRQGDGGIGDFAALATLAQHAGARGAAAIAISPVHAQFSADPHRFSPYAPSSRVAQNILHADARGVVQGDTLPPWTTASGQQTASLVDWPAASRARMDYFREAHRAFASRGTADARAAYAAFRRQRGQPLLQHATFEALHAHYFGADASRWHWRTWPAAMQDPRSAETAAFVQQHADAVDFHAFLQFLADRGIAQAQQAATQAGMAVGLISDLAVGTDSGGSDAWGRQDEMLVGLSIGAPPDVFNTRGQSWGVTTFSPRGMVQHGFAAFLDMLRSAMRHAGGVRIDHVMGLARLWVIPDGAEPHQGAYLRFPVDDLLRLVALESWRNRAIVLGEDLGTLPHGFRERLGDAGIMGLRVMWFERDGERFVAPQHWSRAAVAMTTTHDLPTVAGWWEGHDIDTRARLHMYGDDSHGEAPRRDRDRDRRALWEGLRQAGAVSCDVPAEDAAVTVTEAACRLIGRSACDLALLPLEDALALREQPNLPGTTDQHPNWRRRLRLPVETMLEEPAVAARLTALAEARQTP